MPRSYLDSSAAIKLYLPEKGTDTVRALLQQSDSQCFVAQLALVEVQRSNGTGIPLVRSLDAIHLAAALALSTHELLDHFVSADEDLCQVAALEQLPVLNPEVP